MRWLLLIGVLSAAYAAEASSDGIWKALLDAPPQVEMSKARKAALEALDGWLARPNSERSEECIAYYRNAVDRVIQLLKTERPKKGIRIFQLYSSSVVVQSPSCVFALDLDQGPNEDLHKTPEEEGVPLCMTDNQVADLADLLDYSFHTHEHADHIDYEITKALIDRDKTVVTTESAKAIWANEPWSQKILTLPQTLGEAKGAGKLAVNTLSDHQWNNDAHTSGTPCNAYVITTPEGVTVATKGDINCALQFYGWLNVLLEKGCSIDVITGSPVYWHGVNLTREIDEILKPLWLPGHNWEFVHRHSGEAYGNASPFSRSYSLLHGMAKSGRTSVLSWSEYIDVPQGKGAHRAPRK